MAVYRMSATIVKRSTGRSSCAAAAYRAGCEIEDERTGLSHDYTRKSGVEHSEILAPDDAPEWVQDRAQLWNAVEKAERRKDAQLAREVLLSLPHEMEDEQRRELVREYVREQYVQRGLVADIAIHRAHQKGDDRNHHAHVMLTLRKVDAQGLAKTKERGYGKPEQLIAEREAWAAHQNRALERASLEDRVDHRSLKDRGIDKEPEPKLGPVASKMEREGRKSHAGDDLRAVRARNEERARLAEDRKIIDLEIERERRRIEYAFREARVQDDYAKGIAREAANDGQQGAALEKEEARAAPETEQGRTTATDGYARGDPAPQEAAQPDPAADLRHAREAALRERVSGLEGQIDGRGKASILWGKMVGRIAWDAEQQLETQRAELATMEQARARDQQQRQAAQAREVEQQGRREAERPEPEGRVSQAVQEPEPPVVQSQSQQREDEEYPERLTIAASDAFHAKDKSLAPDSIGGDAEANAKEAEREAKLEQYREMFREARESARNGPEIER